MSVCCWKCESYIPDEDSSVMLVGDGRSLHPACSTCYACGCALTNKCYEESNRLYCPEDYFLYFGPKCNGCCERITYGSLSIKLYAYELYHAECFKCSACALQLCEGQSFGISEGGFLLCADHFYVGDSDSGSEGKENKNRSRGPRTTIKTKQLEVLKSAFASTPKPTRAMRQQLAKETGLPMRVIQVWFQNKRSKEKRMTQMRFLASRLSSQGRPSSGEYWTSTAYPSPPSSCDSYPYFKSPEYYPIDCYPSPPRE